MCEMNQRWTTPAVALQIATVNIIPSVTDHRDSHVREHKTEPPEDGCVGIRWWEVDATR